jgi:hypothetical protein
MARNNEIPDLLAQYMEMCGTTERWITVYELRSYFNLDESTAHAFSGFLRRIYHGPFFSYQYRVKRIEKVLVDTPQRRSINRYLVRKRLDPRKVYPDHSAESSSSSGVHATRLPDEGDHNLCTDYDAVKIFNNVLRSQTRRRLT